MESEEDWPFEQLYTRKVLSWEELHDLYSRLALAQVEGDTRGERS